MTAQAHFIQAAKNECKIALELLMSLLNKGQGYLHLFMNLLSSTNSKKKFFFVKIEKK